MAKKTYPNTPEEEAARINAEAGIQPGEEPAITAEQVASNRAFNENLTNALGFGEGGEGFSLSENPFAKLVSGVSEQVQSFASDAEANLPADSSSLSKTKLDDVVNRLSGGLGSGFNGATAGADIRGEWDDNLGEYTNIDAGTVEWDDNLGEYIDVGGGGGLDKSGFSLSTLTDGAAAVASKFPGGAEISSSLSKLTGGDLAGGIKDLAGGIAKAAGNLNDILSLKRGANLPGGAELFRQTGQEIKLTANPKSDWRIRINANWEYFNSPLFKDLKETGGVVFPIQPAVSFSSAANYNEVSPVHTNYPFLAYQNSKIEDISIAGEFVAEKETDAAYWIAATTFFRTATKMFYGEGENAGNPPIICYLSGYGASVFDNVPVVIKSFYMDFPTDVQYIKCNVYGTSTWVPILSTLNVSLQPIYNRSNLRKFDLKKYASGDMLGYL